MASIVFEFDYSGLKTFKYRYPMNLRRSVCLTFLITTQAIENFQQKKEINNNDNKYKQIKEHEMSRPAGLEADLLAAAPLPSFHIPIYKTDE